MAHPICSPELHSLSTAVRWTTFTLISAIRKALLDHIKSCLIQHPISQKGPPLKSSEAGEKVDLFPAKKLVVRSTLPENLAIAHNHDD